MFSPRIGKANAEVVITVGHVIPDGDDEVLVKNRKDNSFLVLTVPLAFRRTDSRPRCRHQEPSRLGVWTHVAYVPVGSRIFHFWLLGRWCSR